MSIDSYMHNSPKLIAMFKHPNQQKRFTFVVLLLISILEIGCLDVEKYKDLTAMCNVLVINKCMFVLVLFVFVLYFQLNSLGY
jgi:hypothetical protein